MSGRQRISSGSPFERDIGYSRAVADGDWVFVSGTTGRDHVTGEIPTDVVDQVHLIFRTINWALQEAGSSFADVVRGRIIMTDAADDARVAPVIGQYLKPVGPALTSCVAALLDPRLKIEIDVTALKGSGEAKGNSAP